jgi:hypothetical protein
MIHLHTKIITVYIQKYSTWAYIFSSAFGLNACEKNEWNCTYTPPMCLHGVDRENFTFIKEEVTQVGLVTAKDRIQRRAFVETIMKIRPK